MNPADKALWFVESHLGEELTLATVAEAVGVSRFHMARAFGVATGEPLIRYVRARRLSEAAKALAAGAPDILRVAVEAGYGSHEAFTRAFREQFGVTPEALRARGSLAGIPLTEPIKMDETLLAQLAPPRFVERSTLLVAGLNERYNSETCAGIPAQWQRFGPHIGCIPGQVGRDAYGVVHNSDDAGTTEYLCAVEVSDFSRVPAEFARLRIPEQRYAVFRHDGHVSSIRQTWFTIFNRWLPESGLRVGEGPEFERYGEEFDPRSGLGGFEIWIPIQRA